MLGIFKRKPTLSTEDVEFQIATFKWLLRNFGGDDFYNHAKLVLPTRKFFPSKVNSEEEAAYETFLAVKEYAGMRDWACRLEAQEEDVDPQVAPTLMIQNVPQNPLGTFQANDNEGIVVTYNPTIAANPTQLVATLAHELSHYLTATSPTPPPGGWENWEFATDITATFLGFGIFMSNSAFSFQQFTEVDSQGWAFNRSGYLSEAEHIYSLAIFLLLKGVEPDIATAHLKPNLKKMLKKCIKEISATEYINELKAVEYLAPSNSNLSQLAT
ncbi:hypothetical protein [Agarivorans sp. 1_MG-2023]|uniref:hypothetical protein n=1 Tax=Agarivorans sp. 1_MG-2023 TaxID=3062634 RepID=UPI0026E3E8E8|nr:hypothetical protein [Agarivorans sp. 1_MG-2023]MDO6765537.1 hypothetical protein [Agarivorans sp. 1_MG-2023]